MTIYKKLLFAALIGVGLALVYFGITDIIHRSTYHEPLVISDAFKKGYFVGYWAKTSMKLIFGLIVLMISIIAYYKSAKSFD